MDSVIGKDQTLPVDINGRLADSIEAGDYSPDSMTAPSFPDMMSSIKALTMKDYENQITALKKENFNLKLRIYFMEERMQQKVDDSTEDIFKTNIELKVELESMKREMAEKQELLVSASKALESLAGRDTGESQRVREQARREMDALQHALNKKISDLEQDLHAAEEEVEKMATIAEQEKLKNIAMEKQILGLSNTSTPVPGPNQDLQQALQEKDNIIEQLRMYLKEQEGLTKGHDNTDRGTDTQTTDHIRQLTMVIAERDQQLQALRQELGGEKEKAQRDCKGFATKEREVSQLESTNKQLNEDLTQTKTTNENLTKTLEDAHNQNKALSGKLEEKENELYSEKKNSLKRDKTIQGLSQVLQEKEKEIAELCHEIEDRDEALAKARETTHKAQLQKYQGAEEHQSLLMEKQAELSQLQGEHHVKVLEAQKLQRSLARREQELADMQQAKDQLEVELEDFQQQKKKGDKALNDLQNQLKKLTGEIGDRESALEQRYQELLDHTKRKLQAHEVTIQRLTSSLADKDQQLQEYMNMVRDAEQRSPGGSPGVMLSKLRERLKETEKALEKALDERFAAIEEKDNEMHQLQLSLREKERDLERLNNLLSHNDETINSFDGLIKEKDIELQHLANTLKNLQRAKQDLEDNLNRSLREKDSIISQLQLSLQGKTKDMEEMAEAMLSQSQSQARDLAEQMGQRLKVTEALLAEATTARGKLVSDNESAVEGPLATIGSKDQLLKDSSEHHNRMLSEHAQEIQDLKRQLFDRQQQLAAAEKQSSAAAQEGYLEAAELRVLLAEKDSLINKVLERGQERDQFLVELRQKEESDQVLQLRHTIQVLQDQREELSKVNSEDHIENLTVTRKTTVILKKELAQKTESLNKALKRENELKISLAELQSTLSELEGHNDAKDANIQSLTSTLETKDHIINELHWRLGQQVDRWSRKGQDQPSSSETERTLPGLPQRERTVIGGDSQQKTVPSLSSLHEEQAALIRALKTEQHLFSSLIRTVKEQDSSQRLHALQLELAAVQLLRQQLEEGIDANQELREALERELHTAKLREGVDLVDPQELESVKHQLEDAQRWNSSLQARLGAIQGRGGGVGGTSDTGDTLSFLGDQTSYMSICVGEHLEDAFSQLSHQELRQKIIELQECVSRLQSVNEELQKKTLLLESPDKKEELSQANTSPWPQQLEKRNDRTRHPGQDKESQTDVQLGQTLSGNPYGNDNGSTCHGWGGEGLVGCSNTLENQEKQTENDMLLSGAASVAQFRDELLRLRSENGELRGLLEEEGVTGPGWMKRAEEGMDAHAAVRRSVQRAEAGGHLEVIRSLKGQLEGKSARVSDGDSKDNVLEGQHVTRLAQNKTARQHNSPFRTGIRSRIPVPLRLMMEPASASWIVNQRSAKASHHVEVETPRDLDVSRALDSGHPPSEGSQVPSASPGSNTEYTRHSSSPAGSDGEERGTQGTSQPDSPLLRQLELLHQECQEKESLINGLEDKLAEWEELRALLREKDRLNHQYLEALKAAESTIAYLTACNLDGQSGLGSQSSLCNVSVGSDTALQKNCVELHKALREKERKNAHLTDSFNAAGREIVSVEAPSSSPVTALSHAASREPCPRLEAALQGDSRDEEVKICCSEGSSTHREITKTRSDCLAAAESAVASLTAHFTNTRKLSPGTSVQANSDLQHNLDRLKTSLQKLEELEDSGKVRPIKQFKKATNKNSSTAVAEPECQDLYHNICLLYEAFGDHCRRISELQACLQEERGHRGEADQSVKGSPLNVKAQPESLQRALKEKKRMCKSLEEKLSLSAMHNLSGKQTPDSAQKAPLLEQDDKCVQVDLQDLGYETSGKSENDREESSSTDLKVGVQLGQSASSLPSLLKEAPAAFSSTENLDTTSTSSYPSSPALSSHKVSLKSPQAYEDYGMSEDPAELQAQVRELRFQLENQARVAQQMQSLAGRNPFPSNLVSTPIESSMARERRAWTGMEGHCQDGRYTSGASKEKEGGGGSQRMRDTISHLSDELERERSLNRNMNEQLQQAHRSRSASPARLDSLVQSQARELSVLRQQIKESRGLGALHRRQLEDLSKAFKELLKASDVDLFRGDILREQLDRSLSILERLEERLDKGGDSRQDNDGAALERTQSTDEIQKELQYISYPQDSPASILQEMEYLRLGLEGERELLRQHLHSLALQNYILAESSKEKLDLLSMELQEKTRLVQSLQSQLRGQSPNGPQSPSCPQSPSGPQSSCSDVSSSYMASGSCRSSPVTHSGYPSPPGGTDGTDGPGKDFEAAVHQVPPVGGAKVGGVPSNGDHAGRMQVLRRENERLQEQLRGSEDLNATLRGELDLHCSIAAQTQAHGQGRLGSEVEEREGRPASQRDSNQQTPAMSPDLLAEHLQEIRALRRRLEESMQTNDRLREQLERRLAEVEKDTAATNIFIQGTEEQGQLAREVRFLWEQNQALKEQLTQGSRDKHKENDKLRETLARRTAKLEQSRRRCESLSQEGSRLQAKLEHGAQENARLQESMRYSREELHRLQSEVTVQRQQLTDSQHLLQSLRVELQVYEKIKYQAHNNPDCSEGAQKPDSDSVDLGELLSEIRHLRLQLERSIQTNTALRQRLEEQLLRGPHRPDTININYLLSTSEEGGRSPGRENRDPARHSSHGYSEHAGVLRETRNQATVEVEKGSQYNSSSSSIVSEDSVSGTPSRLVPGHRLWANRNGRHVLGLIEDHDALRKQISEGGTLTRNMDTHLQECLHTLKQQWSDNRVLDQQPLKNLSSSVNTMQQVLEEAGRLLKLVWRVSLPTGSSTAGDPSTNQQDDLQKNEVARLKSRLSQHERLLREAIKRLRTTNQLKEGMERVILDQLSVTHGVLKKARGNLEEVPVNGQ